MNDGGGDVEFNEVEAAIEEAYEQGDSKRLEQMISELPDSNEPRPLSNQTWYNLHDKDDSFCYLCRHSGPGDAKFQCNEERTVLEALVNQRGLVSTEELCRAIQVKYNERIRAITGQEWTLDSIRRHLMWHSINPRVFLTEHIQANMNLLEQWYRQALSYNVHTGKQQVAIEAEEHIIKLQKHIESELKMLHSLKQ